MATLAAVRTALRVRLLTITPTIDVYRVWPENINAPAACIMPASPGGDPHTTFAGRGSFFFDIIMVGGALQQGLVKAQDKLDGYMDLSGANSLVGAIEADATLGGNAETVLVGSWTDYGEIIINSLEYMAARLPIEVCVVT